MARSNHAGRVNNTDCQNIDGISLCLARRKLFDKQSPVPIADTNPNNLKAWLQLRRVHAAPLPKDFSS